MSLKILVHNSLWATEYHAKIWCEMLSSSFFFFSGTSVMEGSAQFLVLAVGLNSQTGTIMRLMGVTRGDDDCFDNVSVKAKLISCNFMINEKKNAHS